MFTAWAAGGFGKACRGRASAAATRGARNAGPAGRGGGGGGPGDGQIDDPGGGVDGVFDAGGGIAVEEVVIGAGIGPDRQDGRLKGYPDRAESVVARAQDTRDVVGVWVRPNR